MTHENNNLFFENNQLREKLCFQKSPREVKNKDKQIVPFIFYFQFYKNRQSLITHMYRKHTGKIFSEDYFT